MAKLFEVAGLITDTVGIDPRVVRHHLKGLEQAGRIDGPVTATTCADVLCACLSTDPANATGPFHLPLSGGSTFTEHMEPVGMIDHTVPFFDELDRPFGTFLAEMIESRAQRTFADWSVDNLMFSGAGDELSAAITLIGPIGPDQQGKVWLTYGYKLLPRLLAMPLYGPRLKVMNVVGGHIVEQLGALIAGRSIWEVSGITKPAYGSEISQ